MPESLGTPPAHPRARWFVRHVRDDEVIQPYRHVWNVTIAAWLDEVAAMLFDRPGTVARGLSWFVVEQEIRFRAETMQGDGVVAAAWISGVDRVRAGLEVRLLRSIDRAPLVESRSSWTLVSLASRSPTRVPPDIRAMLDPATDAGGPPADAPS